LSTLETVSARLLLQLGLGASVTSAGFGDLEAPLSLPADGFDISRSGARVDRNTAASHLCFYRRRGGAGNTSHDLVLALPRRVPITQARACMATYIGSIDELMGDAQDPFALVAALVAQDGFRLDDVLVVSLSTLRGEDPVAGLPLSVTLS